MTLNDLFCLFLMELALHHLLTVQIDLRNLSLPASQWQRGCAVLISYLTGCVGHKAFALHYCCWRSRAKKMDDLFVVLPSLFLSHPAPFSSLLPPLWTCFSLSISPGLKKQRSVTAKSFLKHLLGRVSRNLQNKIPESYFVPFWVTGCIYALVWSIK